MSFHEVRFPEDISFGSSGGPEFSTNIVAVQSGHEQRNINWSQARARYNVTHAIKSQSQLDVLIQFFRARQGRAFAFRFKDWADYSAEGQAIAVADGIKTEFQLVKNYVSGATSLGREITKPVIGTVKIYVNGQEIKDVTVDYTNGKISFDTPPETEDIITADFEFDVPVRFDSDIISSRFDDYGVSSVSGIPLIEVRV